MKEANFNAPGRKGMPVEEAAMQYDPALEQQPASAAIAKHGARLTTIDGVEGIGIGQDAIGSPAIVIYVRDQEVFRHLPKNLDGVPVQIQVTGPIDALKPK